MNGHSGDPFIRKSYKTWNENTIHIFQCEPDWSFCWPDSAPRALDLIYDIYYDTPVLRDVNNDCELTWAVKLDWRKAEFFGNVCVLDLQSIVNL